MSSPYDAGGPPSGAPGGKTSLGLDSNVGAMLCYIANFLCCLGVILSIVFLVTEKENRFVKFHALQALFLVAAQIVVGIIVGVTAYFLITSALEELKKTEFAPRETVESIKEDAQWLRDQVT